MRKRSIAIEGHRTSIALEAPFWDALEAKAAKEGRSLASLVAEIDRARLTQTPQPGLASALRVFALSTVRDQG
jgi:predicted DNA-binding ribbon-helix-helix protein